MKDWFLKFVDPMKESREKYMEDLRKKQLEEKLKQFRRKRITKRN